MYAEIGRSALRACLTVAGCLGTAGVLGCGADGDAVLESLDIPEWAIREDLRIGSIDDPDQALTAVGDVLAASDGRVWIVQARDRNIRVYDSTGALQRIVGRPGQGPGEFTLPSGIGWWRGREDTLWVADGFAQRISLFTRAGEFARSFEMPVVEYGSDLQVTEPARILADGSALAIASLRRGIDRVGAVPIIRYDLRAMAVQGQVASLDRTDLAQITWRGQPIATSRHPISDAPVVAIGPDGERIAILDRTAAASPDEATFRLVVVSATGDTLVRRRFTYTPAAIPSTELDSLLADRIASFQRFTRLEQKLTDAEAEEAYRTSVLLPRFRPPIGAALVAPDGRIWLERRGGSEDRAWWVLSASGEPEGIVRTGARLDVRAIGDGYFWVVETDDSDVPYLVRYRYDVTSRDR